MPYLQLGAEFVIHVLKHLVFQSIPLYKSSQLIGQYVQSQKKNSFLCKLNQC